MNVPLKILMNASMPDGKREPVPGQKMRHRTIPIMGRENFHHPVYGPCHRNIDQNVSRLVIDQINKKEFSSRIRMSSYKQQTAELPLGNLDKNGYRYWIGAEERTSRFSKCRACRMTLLSDEDRVAHTEKFKCTVVLTDAFKLLLRDGRCVVCDSQTQNQRYGMPLCSNVCIKNWMFESKDMQAGLMQAVTLAAKNNPTYTNAVHKARIEREDAQASHL